MNGWGQEHSNERHGNIRTLFAFYLRRLTNLLCSCPRLEQLVLTVPAGRNHDDYDRRIH